MSENNQRQDLIEKIHKTVDQILCNAHLTEEEKIRVFQEALKLITVEDNNW